MEPASPDLRLCHRCQAIDLQQVLDHDLQNAADNTADDSGTWMVASFDVHHIKANLSTCPLCQHWAKAIILAQGERVDFDVLNPPNLELELRAFDPDPDKGNSTCWKFEFDRYGALKGQLPRKILFVCPTGSRSFQNTTDGSDTMLKRKRDGMLLALFDKETWQTWYNRLAPTYDKSLSDFKLWIADELSETEYEYGVVRGNMPCKRLIDCSTFLVVPAELGMHYTALSYCWSLAQEDMVSWPDTPTYSDDASSGREKSPQPSLFASWGSRSSNTQQINLPFNSDFISDLPDLTLDDLFADEKLENLEKVEISRVIRDAARITRRLGITYLWVDKLCIDQKNPEELISQIHEMDLIYEFSEMTLIVANSDGRMDGPTWTQASEALTLSTGLTLLPVPEPCKNEMDEVLWPSRAWTFQEDVCSHRAFFFTDNGIFYRGDEFIWDARWRNHPHSVRQPFNYRWDSNDHLSFEVPNVWLEVKRHLKEWFLRTDDYPTFCWEFARLWNRLASEYTRRKLSYPGDVKHGFFGLNETMSTAVTEIFGINFTTLQGIPFFRAWTGKTGESQALAKKDVTSAAVGTDDSMKRVTNKGFEEVRLKVFLLSLLWIAKEPNEFGLRMPGEYWQVSGELYGHKFSIWSWVGWIGHVIWIYDVLTDTPLSAASQLISRCGVMFKPDFLNVFESMEELDDDRCLELNTKSLHSGVLRLHCHRIEHHRLELDKADGWKMLEWSINPDPPLEAWQNFKDVRCKQDIWDGIEQKELVCILLAEQRKPDSIRLFCLIIYRNTRVRGERYIVGWKQGWYRKGVVVLEKNTRAEGNSATSLAMPFDDREELESFDLL